MDGRNDYLLRVLRRVGGWRDQRLTCTPKELMAEALRVRREPGAVTVEVLHDGEHLYALG